MINWNEKKCIQLLRRYLFFSTPTFIRNPLEPIRIVSMKKEIHIIITTTVSLFVHKIILSLSEIALYWYITLPSIHYNVRYIIIKL